MALTFSHPAVSLPFKKLGLAPCALIVGSIIPDFEFFLRMTPQRLVGHTAIGILTFCLPVGFGVLLLYHTILKQPLISLMPREHRKRLLSAARSYPFFRIRRIWNIFISLTIGILTHIGWDAFTHADGWFVLHISPLQLSLLEIPGIGVVRMYFALHYLTSAAGLFMLIHWYQRWATGSGISFLGSLRNLGKLFGRIHAVTGLATGALAGGTIYGMIMIVPSIGIEPMKHFISQSAIAGVTFFLAGIVLFSIVWHLTGARKSMECS